MLMRAQLVNMKVVIEPLTKFVRNSVGSKSDNFKKLLGTGPNSWFLIKDMCNLKLC